MSASRSPVRRPSPAKAHARLTATVDLPTPPFPLATAITRRTWARGSGRRRSGRRGQHHLGLGDAGDGHERFFGGVAHGGVEGGLLRRDLEHEAGAPFAQHQALDQAGGGEPAAGPGIGDGVEGRQDRVAVGLAHR